MLPLLFDAPWENGSEVGAVFMGGAVWAIADSPPVSPVRLRPPPGAAAARVPGFAPAPHRFQRWGPTVPQNRLGSPEQRRSPLLRACATVSVGWGCQVCTQDPIPPVEDGLLDCERNSCPQWSAGYPWFLFYRNPLFFHFYLLRPLFASKF